MNNTTQSGRGAWTGVFAFVLAASGSAVGLGNVWKFPYITGMNGGGAFVLIYLACIAVVGLPLLASEMFIGRAANSDPVTAFRTLPARHGRLWSSFGWLAVVTAFVLLSYYSVVGGWTLAYMLKALTGQFGSVEAEAIPTMFDTFVGTKWKPVVFHAVFMVAVMGIVLGGVRRGIERASKILMPILALLLLGLFFRALFSAGGMRALHFMFYPDFSKLTPAGVLEAMGHAFFTLSLGMGAIVVYGSYLQRKESVFKASLAVALLDTAIALFAGVMIFGIVFSFNLEPGAGPSLIFKTMPVLFSQMTGGAVLALAFFLLLAFAAVTSAISILEVVVSYIVDHDIMPRRQATVIFGLFIFLLGIPSAIGTTIGGKGIFDMADYLVSNWALPIGGLGVALFMGWAIDKARIDEETADDPWRPKIGNIWYLTTRYVAPAAVVLVILHQMGVL